MSTGRPRMGSQEFRRAYPTLRTPTLVTANGHVIGLWTPINTTEIDMDMETALALASGEVSIRPVRRR